MAETPVDQPSLDPVEHYPFAEFNSPDNVLQRRLVALEQARRLQEESPTSANQHLIETLEVDIAQRTQGDTPVQMPSPE